VGGVGGGNKLDELKGECGEEGMFVLRKTSRWDGETRSVRMVR